MSGKNNTVFEDLKRSIKGAVAISKGEKVAARRTAYSAEEIQAIKEGRSEEVKAAKLAAWKNEEAPDVKDIREKLELSQSEFARLIKVSVRTLQNWEQGSRHPTGPAEVLLELVAKSPKAVLETLHFK